MVFHQKLLFKTASMNIRMRRRWRMSYRSGGFVGCKCNRGLYITFLNPALQDKYHLRLPAYPGASQCVRLGGPAGSEERPSDAATSGNGAGGSGADPASIRLNYSLAESSGGLMEADVDPDPFKQFDRWFKVGSASLGCAAPAKLACATFCKYDLHYAPQSSPHACGSEVRLRELGGPGCNPEALSREMWTARLVACTGMYLCEFA